MWFIDLSNQWASNLMRPSSDIKCDLADHMEVHFI